MEFLDLPANEHFNESDLEQALIDHLQKFLLELGRGYSFVARQKHFNVDGRHFYIDLVFYNYRLSHEEKPGSCQILFPETYRSNAMPG